MIARYFHIIRNLPGILDRIERELGSKATKASVDTLRFTVTKKADTEFVVNLSGIINERFAERPTMADLSQAKIDLGVRIDGVEREVETLALNAVKTGEPNLTDTLGRVVRIDQHPGLIIEKAPRKPRAPKGGAK